MNPPETYLGLDLGTKTGWCIRTPEGAPRVGTWKLDGPPSEKGIQLIRQIRRKIRENGVGCLAYEDAAPLLTSSKNAALLRFGLIMVVEIVVELLPTLRRLKVHPGTLKKHATGHGGSKKNPVRKDDMIRAAIAAGAPPGLTPDEADAWWVSDWAQKTDVLYPRTLSSDV